MKKLVLAVILVTGVFSLSLADAAQPRQISGRTYGVTIYCLEDVGAATAGGGTGIIGQADDYCTQGALVNETLI